MKYLLTILLLLVVWLLWTKRHSAENDLPAQRPDPLPEKMVACSHCGVHLPESEGVCEDGRIYCCEAHRAAARVGKS